MKVEQLNDLIQELKTRGVKVVYREPILTLQWEGIILTYYIDSLLQYNYDFLLEGIIEIFYEMKHLERED